VIDRPVGVIDHPGGDRVDERVPKLLGFVGSAEQRFTSSTSRLSDPYSSMGPEAALKSSSRASRSVRTARQSGSVDQAARD
jgi:hypothetical protein